MAKRVYLLSEARGLSRDLLGGKGHGLAEMAAAGLEGLVDQSRPIRPARPHAASPAELAAHAEFLKKISDPLWLKAEAA